jgi:capsular polysaccharide transport system permease protein
VAPAVKRPPAAPPTVAAAPRAARRPMARPARVKRRHWGLLASFLLIVVLPVAATGIYLRGWAVDQYASILGFTVRSENTTSASDLLGGLGATLGATSGSRDSDILFEFIRSQELVAAIDAELDLRGIYSRHQAEDPVFGFDPSGTVEDLTTYWQRMVRTSYDASSGLIELRVLAFTPEEAQAIAAAINAQSTTMINNLSAIARNDATRYAREDLDLALERLKTAREALTAYRVENQIVDVAADIQGQMGLLANLQAQLATALIDMDLLRSTTSDSDPRMSQARSRIAVIEARIEEERRKFGTAGSGPGDRSYAATVGEFERLTVDREFAESAYIAALSAFDVARAEANRQSRYLAAYVGPTLAERSEFPRSLLLTGLVLMFSFLIWSILCLIYYSLRDRR